MQLERVVRAFDAEQTLVGVGWGRVGVARSRVEMRRSCCVGRSPHPLLAPWRHAGGGSRQACQRRRLSRAPHLRELQTLDAGY
jgi:hypothetical protein